LAVGVLAALVWALPGSASPASADLPILQPSITLTASATHTVSSRRVVLSGRVSGALPGSKVRLYAAPYPYRTATLVASTTAAPDGSFSFTVFPDRNVIYAALVAGTSARAQVAIHVGGRALVTVSALALGRAKVVVVLFHPSDLRWNGVAVSWSFASGRHGRWLATPSTHTIRLSPYVTLLYTTVALPAGPFSWRACFTAPDDHALEIVPPPHCSGRGYYGAGSLPVGFPAPAAIDRAERYLASRGGHTALAVIDSEGRLSGARIHDRFITGSVVKAMLLVAYLRHLDAIGEHHIESNSNSFLFPMIHVSDNNAAEQCWNIVGDSGMYAVARAAGMTDFSVDTTASWGASWGAALISAADQARFFFEMDSLIPREFVGYARFLLSTISPQDTWGIPTVARPLGYQVFFKAGWRPSPDIFLVHQIARLEGHRRTFAIAVMTDGDPGMSYGIDTIQGVTARLLG
jgi:hypothetical protein